MGSEGLDNAIMLFALKLKGIDIQRERGKRKVFLGHGPMAEHLVCTAGWPGQLDAKYWLSFSQELAPTVKLVQFAFDQAQGSHSFCNFHI